MRFSAILLMSLCAGSLLTGCASLECRECMVESDLYFGLSRKVGPPISQREWQRFVDTQVTPRFPDGLTVLDANGQWKGRTGLPIRERSKLMILVHRASPDTEREIKEICEGYKRAFNQESVLWTETRVRARF